MSEPPPPMSAAKRPFTVVCRVDESASYFVTIEATSEVAAAVAARRLGHAPLAVRWTDDSGASCSKAVTIHPARPETTDGPQPGKEQRPPCSVVEPPRSNDSGDGSSGARGKRRRPIPNYHTRQRVMNWIGWSLVALATGMVTVTVLVARSIDGGAARAYGPKPSDVYKWCQDRRAEAERDGAFPSDRDILQMAAQHFDISEAKAEQLYIHGGLD